MKFRIAGLSLGLLTLAPLACAGDGLQMPAAESVWPQWQARIAMQANALSPLTLGNLGDGGSAARSLRGGALLGDFYFAVPSFGGFRASGGLLVGAQGGGALAGYAAPGSYLSLGQSYAGALPAANEALTTATYLGLGFTTARTGSGLALSADVGMVAERLGAAAGLGRAIFGNQGMDSALRDMRLSPTLQLGMRYSF